jgi:ERCC4-related helicase
LTLPYHPSIPDCSSWPIEFLPRHLANEIQRVEREYQNQQVEHRLVAALSKGQEYFQTKNFSQIDTKELEEVIDISSNVRQRSQRTSMLFESAQKVLNLRRGLKMADWTGIRCWLGESSELAMEATREVETIQKMSDANYRMHEYLSEAMQQHRVGGRIVLSLSLRWSPHLP